MSTYFKIGADQHSALLRTNEPTAANNLLRFSAINIKVVYLISGVFLLVKLEWCYRVRRSIPKNAANPDIL